jgi:hypothetical protein
MLYAFFTFLSAVQSQTSFRTIPCNKLGIQICPIYDASWGSSSNLPNPPASNCQSCSAASVNCRRFQYSVDLVAQGSSNMPLTSDFYLNYKALAITMLLTTANATGVPLSRIEVETSNGCIPLNLKNYMQVFENSVALNLFAPGNEQLPFLLFTAQPPQSVYRSHLFNVIVDAWPGETVNFACSATSYQDGDGVICPSPTNTNQLSCSPSGQTTTVNIPQPAPASGLVCVNFDQTPNTDPVQYDNFLPIVPLFLKSIVSQNSAIESLDFLVKVNSVNPIEEPEIIINPAFSANFKEKRVIKIPNSNDYWLRLRLENVVVKPNSNPELLKIKIHRPMNSSLAGMVALTLTPGRLTGTMNGIPACEMTCVDPQKVNICYPGYNPCASDGFKFKIQGVEPAANECHSKLLLSLNWTNPSGVSADFHHVKLDLEFKTSGDLISSNYVNQTVYSTTCTSCNNPLNPIPGCINDNSWNGCGNGSPIFTYANNHLLICFDAASNYATWINNGFIELNFAGVSGSVSEVIVRQAEIGVLSGGVKVSICAAPVEIVKIPVFSSTRISGLVTNWVNNIPVENVTIAYYSPNTIPPPPPIQFTNTSGNFVLNYGICAFAHTPPNPNQYVIKPNKITNPLNGVNTFDLVRISRHVLNNLPFTSPFQFIAGDINHNGVVTTSDIVELRKLILGIYTEFPLNTSWRFVDKSFLFDNNAPLAAFPENITVDLANSVPANFTAVKIGDLTGDASNNFIGEKPNYSFTKSVESSEKGFVTFPIKASGDEPLIALQAGFKFNPAEMEFIGVSQAGIKGVNADCFGYNELEKGLIKFIWLSSDMEMEPLLPGQTLCFLTFKLKNANISANSLSFSKDAAFESIGFTMQDKIYALQMETPKSESFNVQSRSETNVISSQPQIQVVPNPTNGATKMMIELPADEAKVRFSVYGPFGVRMFYKELNPLKGSLEIPIPESANWSSGVYLWQWVSKNTKMEGRIIRL